MIRTKKKSSAQKELLKKKIIQEEESLSSAEEDDICVTKEVIIQPTEKKRKREAVWQDSDDSDDDDDEGKRTKRFEKEFGPIPQFLRSSKARDARSDSESDSEDEESTGNRAQPKARAGPILGRSVGLPPNSLQYKRVRDANADLPAKAMVSSVRFHPWSPVVMVGSTDRTINFFHVDGDSNDKLSSHYFDHFPIKCARFTPKGDKVIATSIRKSFRVLDLESETVLAGRSIRGVDHAIQEFEISPDGRYVVFIGMWGALHLLDLQSLEKVATLEANGRVMSLAFSSESYLYAFGDNGRVHRFSMSALRLEGSFLDEGCVGGRAVAVSRDDGLLACGHSTGVVNVYRHADTFRRPASDLATPAPAPLRTADNLLTSCDRLRFAPSGEYLLMASSHESNAVRALHVASHRVFANFPGRERFAKVTDLDVSPGGAYVALGQSDGRASLLRFLHYGQY